MDTAAGTPWVLIAPGARTPKSHVVEPRGDGWTTLCGQHTRTEPVAAADGAPQCGRCSRMVAGTWRSHAGYPSGLQRAAAS